MKRMYASLLIGSGSWVGGSVVSQHFSLRCFLQHPRLNWPEANIRVLERHTDEPPILVLVESYVTAWSKHIRYEKFQEFLLRSAFIKLFFFLRPGVGYSHVNKFLTSFLSKLFSYEGKPETSGRTSQPCELSCHRGEPGRAGDQPLTAAAERALLEQRQQSYLKFPRTLVHSLFCPLTHNSWGSLPVWL